MLSRHERKICDSLFPYTFIMDNKHVMTFYSITSKLKHWLQNHEHLLSQQVKFSFPLPAPHSQGEETFRTKETFSVCLFIPLLAQYLFTPVTHLFFFFSCLSNWLSPAAFSHTQALQQREKDLGDHLKPIMAALQPPRNSVTDGDLVFIAGVIGNTQTHT